MKMRFMPSRYSAKFIGVVDGDTITVNGEVLDFTQLQEGGRLPVEAISAAWLVGGAHRLNGDVYVTIICPHGANAPHETLFPSSEYIDVVGEIPFPVYNQDVEGQ